VFYFRLKRVFDFSLALFGLFIFFPFMAIIPLLIFAIYGRPVFYCKTSVGQFGKVFKIMKFRSMDTVSSRITKIGKILRQTAMDELPQLINIIKGEMSFVGPRPYSLKKYGLTFDSRTKKIEVNNLNSDSLKFFQRLSVIPGLTGLAQIHTPKHAQDEEVLKLDLEYIKKENLLLDLYLILISIWISITHSWEEIRRKI